MNASRNVRGTTACLVVAAYLVVFTNGGLWRALASQPTESPALLIGAIGLIMTGAFNLILMLFCLPGVFKPVSILLITIGSVTSYVIAHLGVPIDVGAIRNLMETDVGEATELISVPFAAYVLVLGVLPSVALMRARIEYGSPRSEIVTRGGIALLSFLIAGGAAAVSYKDLVFTFRQNPTLRVLLNPSYPIYSAFKYARRAEHSGRGAAPIAIGLDAHIADPPSDTRRPRLVVLVVGETARAAEFSLNGYPRVTNPALGRLGVVNFPNVTACGTSTAESLPCMFSTLARHEYSPDKAHRLENLLDVVQRAGVDVLWRDNNSGCKGVCDRVPHESLSHAKISGICRDGECFDEILLDHLQEIVDRSQRDLLVVLHQKGSHGPAYYRRVPAAFERFTPECARDDVWDCSREEIVNAYDNTILYTDFVLSRLVELLELNDATRDTAMLYVSDHGESLGENGIYLHGFPFFIAPEDQTHVPMIFWASPGFYAANDVDSQCLRQVAGTGAYSHQNIFHSVLGALDVLTEAYEPTLDLLASCRSHRPA